MALNQFLAIFSTNELVYQWDYVIDSKTGLGNEWHCIELEGGGVSQMVRPDQPIGMQDSAQPSSTARPMLCM